MHQRNSYLRESRSEALVRSKLRVAGSPADMLQFSIVNGTYKPNNSSIFKFDGAKINEILVNSVF